MRCCHRGGSGRRSCCDGLTSLNDTTSRPAAPTKDAAPPAAKKGRSHHPKAAVVVLGAMINDTANGRTYDDLEYLPLWQAAEQMGAIMFIHQ